MASSEIAKRRAAAKRESSEHYAAKRAELIAAAARVFKEKGFRAASIDDIAKIARADRASVYYYVSGKSELFHEVVRGALEANTLMAENISAGEGSPAAKLEAVIQALMTSYGENYPYLFVFVQEDAAKVASGAGGKAILALSRRFEQAVENIIEAGMADGAFRSDIPPRVAAFGVIGMVNWTHRWYTPKGELGADEIGRAFATLASEGLRTRSRRESG